MVPAPDPNDPRIVVHGGQDHREHPAVHLAAARQRPQEAALPGQRADTARVGRKDRLVSPAYGEDFQAAIAGSRLEVVKDAGHLPHLEQFDKTQSVITEFLEQRNSHPPRRPAAK